MGKKKKKAPKVWCYYCEREFDDEKILIQHQKAKHFKCHVCYKKLSTAGGLVIHVLQVHKESITKVPNSKPDRESTDIEIYGMDGIPSEVLAAHEGDQEDEKSTKVAKIEVPPSGPGGLIMGPAVLGMAPQPIYAAMPRAYVTSTPGVIRPPIWHQQSLSSQPWSSSPIVVQPPVIAPRHPPPISLQPLFPIQSIQNPPAITPLSSQSPSQPLFPIHAIMPPSPLPIPSAQPPIGINGPPIPPVPVPGMTSFSSVPPAAVLSRVPSDAIANESSSVSDGIPTHTASFLASTTAGKSPNTGGSHMYASGPNTGCPIGPPPVICNKAPSQVVANEVYLMWDDEAMSMEERRMSLPQYQVHDEASQMHSVDAAIDKRILESRLAGRMTLGV